MGIAGQYDFRALPFYFSAPITSVTTTRDAKDASMQVVFRTPKNTTVIFQPLSPRELGLWVRTSRELLRRAGSAVEPLPVFQTGLASYGGTAAGLDWGRTGKVERWALELA